MIVRMGLLRKKPDWAIDDFNAYWRGAHGPLAARLPGLREYWQNRVVDRIQRGIDYPRGPWDFDGFSQLTFDDTSRMQHGIHQSEVAAALVTDERYFLGTLNIVAVEQNVVVPVPEAEQRAKLFKRMSLLKRRDDISEDDFRREWITHRDLLRQMVGVAGYRQNVIIARERVKGTPSTYAELPIDGIVELWFENAATLEAAFNSPAGRAAMQHARSFLAEITVFAIAELRVV